MSLPRRWAESCAAAVYMMTAGFGLVVAGVWYTVDTRRVPV